MTKEKHTTNKANIKTEKQTHKTWKQNQNNRRTKQPKIKASWV